MPRFHVIGAGTSEGVILLGEHAEGRCDVCAEGRCPVCDSDEGWESSIR